MADSANPGLHAALGPTPLGATFQWPWDIASAGGRYFSSVSTVATSLAGAAQAFSGSPQGPAILSRVTADPTDIAAAQAARDAGIFGAALDAVKADSLLRTTFLGWSMGAQVGLFGGGGGSGVATDLVNPATSASVTYGMFKLGIGAQVAGGLLVGAMARAPAELNASTCVFEFGAAILGAGALVCVIMDDNLGLIGFTVNIGAGAGLASSTGYGSISAR